MDTSIPIVALTMTASAVQHRALPIARSAGRLGIPVHAVAVGRAGPTAASRYLQRPVTLPADASEDQVRDALLELGRRLGRSVLVPLEDASTVFVDDNADALSEHFAFPRRPPGTSRLLASKRELHLLCERLGLPSPRAAFPADGAAALAEAGRLGYPVVAKRIDAWLVCNDPEAPSVFVAGDPESLSAAFARMESPSASNVMLQEYIPGDPTSVWMFNGYFDARSEALVAFTGRKLRQHPPYSGATSLGLLASNAAVDHSMRTLLREVGYRGIVDAGFRYDARDGQYKLLDVNPRIGATFRLFVGEDGMDVLRAQHLDLTGRPVPATRQVDGRRWIAEPFDLHSSYQYWRNEELTPRAWLRSLRGVQEAAWLAKDDPLPALAVTLPLAGVGARNVFRAAGRLARGRRRAVEARSGAAPRAS